MCLHIRCPGSIEIRPADEIAVKHQICVGKLANPRAMKETKAAVKTLSECLSTGIHRSK